MTVKLFLTFLFLSSLSLLGYLFLASNLESLTFPLDDAWIHHAYARNLVRNGEWAFISGQPSAGATSFLWVILLAIGYVLQINPFYWTVFLGILLLAGFATVVFLFLRKYMKLDFKIAAIIGALFVFEWHLAWAALSGMETLLFSFFASLLLIRLLSPLAKETTNTGFWSINFLILSAASLTRPEGITLLAPLILIIFIAKGNWKDKRKTLLIMIGTFLLFMVPYLLFNRALSGSVFPNTFYAKQAEYAILLDTSFASRALSLLKLPLVGIGVILLPGFYYFVASKVKGRKWPSAIITLWLFGFTLLYAGRLPLAYQHGRYIIPIMPLFFLFGTAGIIRIISGQQESFWKRPIRIAAIFSSLIVLTAFWWLGATAYAEDIYFIESQMVDTANWVTENINEDSLIAAHDIGALGYFTERNILDLAGLISPDVIPIIRDERALETYLNENSVDYLIAFPDWYPELTNLGKLIYQSRAVMLGGSPKEGLAVYLWP